MKNVTTLTLVCALLGFSLVAFAAKGPCEDVPTERTTATEVKSIGGEPVSKTVTQTDIFFDDVCAGKNEENCELEMGEDMLKTKIVVITYTYQDGEWSPTGSMSVTRTYGVNICS